MPSLRDMKKYADENRKLVWVMQQIIVDATRSSDLVRAELNTTPDLLSGAVRTFAILLLMGYGSQPARDILIPKYVMNRLEQ
jgi:hypothetical protein